MPGTVDRRVETTRAMAQKAVAEKKSAKRFTAHQVVRQMQLVTDAWVEGATDREIVKVFEEAYNAGKIDHVIGRNRVTLLRERAQQKLLEDAETERPYTKTQQARRITKALRECKGVRGPNGKWLEKPDHMARSRYEDMIARIQGNYEPVRIEVDAVHRHAIAEVIASLTPEQMAHYEQSFDRIMELAEGKAKELGEPLTTLLPKPPNPSTMSNGGTNGAAHRG